MKKISFVLIIILCICILCGCGINNIIIPPLPTATPIPYVTTAPTPTPEPVIIPAGLESRITVRIIDETQVAYDPVYFSIPILNFRYQIPFVSIENNDSASELINTKLSELNFKYMSVDGVVGLEMDKYNEMLSLATDSYDSDNQMEFKFFRQAQVLRADDNLICIKFTNTTVQFGNETVEDEIHYFDTSTGTEISESLISDDAYPKAEKNESGTLVILDASSDKFDLVDLVEVDFDGDDYMLACEGMIYDIYIGDDWYSNILNNDAIQLKVTLDENSTGLFVRFISEYEQYTYLIIKDPETGSAILVDSEDVLG